MTRCSLLGMNGQPWAFTNPRTKHPDFETLSLPSLWLPCQRLPRSLYNKNGSGHHPYYACIRCGKFACLGDMRDVLSENPTCLCDHVMQLSRRATAGADGGETRILRSMSCRCAPVKVLRGRRSVTFLSFSYNEVTALGLLIDHFNNGICWLI